MSDIVERLRRDSVWTEGLSEQQIQSMCEEAADEIERLRAALREIADLKYECGDSECGAEHIARAALEGK